MLSLDFQMNFFGPPRNLNLSFTRQKKNALKAIEKEFFLYGLKRTFDFLKKKTF